MTSAQAALCKRGCTDERGSFSISNSAFSILLQGAVMSLSSAGEWRTGNGKCGCAGIPMLKEHQSAGGLEAAVLMKVRNEETLPISPDRQEFALRQATRPEAATGRF
jgi:hypothetical protein